jgi:hypothetical protein
MVTTQILAVVAAEARSMSWEYCDISPPLQAETLVRLKAEPRVDFRIGDCP